MLARIAIVLYTKGTNVLDACEVSKNIKIKNNVLIGIAKNFTNNMIAKNAEKIISFVMNYVWN